MAIQELHVHTTCRVKERSWTQSHLLKCYRLWQVDFSIALFFARNLIRFYEKYSIPLNYNVAIWADLCIQITLDRTLYHTPFLSQRIGDTFKLSQIPKYNFLFYLETVLQKLKFPYTPNLSNWTIVKTKIEATTSLSWLHAQSSIDALFNFLDMQLWWYQIIKGIKKIYSISKPKFNKNIVTHVYFDFFINVI